MPKTAYSNQFQGEYDLGQLLRRLGHPDDVEPLDVPASIRAWIAADVQCPGCGARGATVVTAARSTRGSVRAQAHFRFGGAGRPDAHNPMCEFFGDQQSAQRSAHLVDFNVSRSAQTRLVRDLVCRGIAIGTFSQQTMQSMRQWFLAERSKTAFTLQISDSFIRQCSEAMKHAWPQAPAFRPAMGDLPNIEWLNLASRTYFDENRDLFEEHRSRPGSLHGREISRVLALAKKWNGQLVYDPSQLRDRYAQTIELAQFVAATQSQARWPVIQAHSVAPASLDVLLAFCALLLYCTDWNSGHAIDSYVEILRASPADDLAGNIIGLNPFHDYWAWNGLMIAVRFQQLRPTGLDVKGDLARIVEEHRRLYQAWKVNL